MKKIFLLTTSLLFAFFLNAQVSKTVNVSAGGLSTQLTSSEKSTITNLTVTGFIDARDIKCIRDQISNLSVLDISSTIIMPYIGTLGTSTSTNYPPFEMPEYSFHKNWGASNTKLTSIKLPTTLLSIGNMAFFECMKLSSVTIPNSVTTIGSDAFEFCSGLVSLSIGNSVTSIGNYAFWNCTGLTSLTIPNSVTSIGIYAFSGCSSLVSLSIGNSVTSIGDYAFGLCDELTSIYVYAITPVVLGSGVFGSVDTRTCSLYLPTGSKSAYEVAPGWGDFIIFIEGQLPVTGIINMKKNVINLYPNPVTDGFYIDGLEATSNLTLTDFGGKILLTKQITANEYVSVGILPKGVYIAILTSGNSVHKIKIVKR